MSILDSLSSYLPHPMAARILRDPQRSLLGWNERFDAVTIFADIAGFTPLAEALGQLGPRGAEELTTILNNTFTPLIEHTHHWGGTVGKFAGDAFTAHFSGPDATLRALSCALALQGHVASISTFHTDIGDFSIGMKFGLAAGAVLMTIVGTSRRAEFIFAGHPLINAGMAENLASPGDIVLHPTLLDRLPPDAVHLVPTADDHALLQELRQHTPPGPLLPPPPCPDHVAAQEALRPFLPRPIYERLVTGAASFINEHRRVTVLFVRFDGIDYDAPDGPELLGQYVRQEIEIVNQFGGYIRQIIVGEKGSQMVILFGAPLAHEKNEERALLCALALQESVKEIDWITDQRIGINTGRVYTGNVGSSRRQEYTAIGDAINLAARLMQATVPGQVLVGEMTYQAAAQRLSWHPPTKLKVKGKAGPVTVYELAGRASDHPLRLQEPRYALPMVGRQKELARLEQLLQQVSQTGRGHTVGITAEAGMGKSRLAAEVIPRAFALGFQGLGGSGISHGTSTPYLAWRPILRGLLNLRESMPNGDEIERARLHLTAIAPELAARFPLLGDLLGLDIPDNDLTASFDADLRRQSLFALIVDLIRHLATSTPLLLVLEDAHWLDDISRELARYVGRAIFAAKELPVLFLTVYRPPEIEVLPPLWEPPPRRFAEVRLDAFSSEECTELIRLKLGGRTLPSDIVGQIVERAQGNPFFLDEFMNLIQDRGIDLDDPEALTSLEIPDSLQSLIISRLDQLSESQMMTVRVASVIGRLFRARWLLAIYPGQLREDLLRSQLSHLDGVELVLVDRPDPELEYLFKHAITHEVVYETLSFANRRTLHQRVAEHIESDYAGQLEAWYGILVYHYERAGQPEKEFKYAQLAAEQAARQHAVRQAVDIYTRAIELADTYDLCSPEEAFDLRIGRFAQNGIRGEYEALLQDADALLALAKGLDSVHQVKARIKKGVALWRLGQATGAIDSFEAAADLAHQIGDRTGLGEALMHRGYAFFSAGDYEQGKAMLSRVIEEAGESGWKLESRACQVMGWIACDEGDLGKAESYWQRSLTLRQSYGDRPGEALVLSNLGVVYSTQNYVEKGIAYNEQSLTLAQQVGYKVGELESRLRLGEIDLQVGRYDQSWKHLDDALALSDQLASDVWGQSYIRSRMTENILRSEGDLGEGERLIHEALDIGRSDGGKELLGWLLHTYGRVLAKRGEVEDAQQALAESAQLRREVGQMITCAVSLGDLGLLHLGQGEKDAARTCADEIKALLLPDEGKATEGEEIIPASLACYRIYQAVGEDEYARDAIRHAYETLQVYASRIETDELRRSFLENVVVNREVIAAYDAVFGEDTGSGSE